MAQMLNVVIAQERLIHSLAAFLRQRSSSITSMRESLKEETRAGRWGYLFLWICFWDLDLQD